MKILKIVLPVVASALVLTCIVLVCLSKFRGTITLLFFFFTFVVVTVSETKNLIKTYSTGKKRRRNESEKKLVHGSSVRTTSSEPGERNPTTGDLEFPSIQFRDIAIATDDFSRACLIGRGGFGKVYKVLVKIPA
jgi:hypothetical protein